MNANLLARVALAGLAVALLAPSVEARHRYRRPSAPSCVVAAPVATPAVSAGATTYQSFSYEPGAVAVAAPVSRAAAAPARRVGDRFDAPYLYGDSKASGRYLWSNR